MASVLPSLSRKFKPFDRRDGCNKKILFEGPFRRGLTNVGNISVEWVLLLKVDMGQSILLKTRGCMRDYKRLKVASNFTWLRQIEKKIKGTCEI